MESPAEHTLESIKILVSYGADINLGECVLFMSSENMIIVPSSLTLRIYFSYAKHGLHAVDDSCCTRLHRDCCLFCSRGSIIGLTGELHNGILGYIYSGIFIHLHFLRPKGAPH